MVACIAVVDDNLVGSQLGSTKQVTNSKVKGGTIVSWEEFAIWRDTLRQTVSERAHHARVTRLLPQRGIGVVLVCHIGEDMHHMLHGLLEVLS
jgi:hypothetical protein